jgi:putative ABC transport system permease protein
VIRHPFVQPPLFGGQAHFFVDEAGLERFGIPAGVYGQLLVQIDSYSLENAQAVAGEIRSTLGRQGFVVAVNLYQDPDKHWGHRFVEGINLVLQVMAVVSAFLSVILILNIFTALITQQTDQIGVIKAIGGRRWRIIQLFLTEAVAYGVLALLVSLPLGMLFAYGMSGWFLNLFNIDFPVFQISKRAVFLQVSTGFLAPLLAALWPVLKGSAVTVREAIASYGLGGDFKVNRLDRIIVTYISGYLSTTLTTALVNIFRRKSRLSLTLMVLTVAGVMFLVVMSLISSVNLTLDNEMARQRYDLRIGFTQHYPTSEVIAELENEKGIQDLELWSSYNAAIFREDERLEDSAGLGAQLIGIPSGSSFYRPIIIQGRWLEQGDEKVVVISQETAEKNNLQPGDSIVLDLGAKGRQSWLIAGTYRVVYGSGFVVEPIYAPLEFVAAAAQENGQASQLLVRGEIFTLDEEALLSTRIKDILESAGYKIDIYTTTGRLDQRTYVDNQFASVISMLLSLAALMAGVGAMGLMGSQGISVVERTREIGVMRSIGARSRTILGLYIMEGIFQGFLSFIAAVPAAFFLARPLAYRLGMTMLEVDLDYAFNYSAVGIWLAVVVIISVLSSILPGKSATEISIRESLAYS